eukprot:3875174-Rhodomonas_salina.1
MVVKRSSDDFLRREKRSSDDFLRRDAGAERALSPTQAHILCGHVLVITCRRAPAFSLHVGMWAAGGLGREGGRKGRVQGSGRGQAGRCEQGIAEEA